MLRACVAELIGTFALVFAGAGAVMVDAKTGALGHVGVAITFGLVIMVDDLRRRAHLGRALQPGRVFRIRDHPALPMARVSSLLDRAAVRRTACRRPAASVARQRGARRRDASFRLNTQSFIWEIVLTAFLMFVIMAVATDTRAVGEAAAIAIGGTVGLDAMFGGPDLRRIDESRTIGWACDRQRRHALTLDLPGGTARRGHGGSCRLPVRPRIDPHERPVRLHRERWPERDQRAAARTRRRRPPSRAERGQQARVRRSPRGRRRVHELGIDASDHVPQKLSQELIDWADVVVATCDDSCPYVPGKHYANWQLPDPKGRPIERVREIRDDIATRVAALVRDLDGATAGA